MYILLIFENTWILIFIKICPIGPFLHTEGQTDRQADRQTERHVKDNSHFSQFYEYIEIAQLLYTDDNEQCLLLCYSREVIEF